MITTDNLEIGMVLKNLKALGETLNDPMPERECGNSRKSRLERWHKICDWEKVPHSQALRITKVIHDAKQISGAAKKVEYRKEIQILMLYLFRMTGSLYISCTNRQLIQKLSIIEDGFMDLEYTDEMKAYGITPFDLWKIKSSVNRRVNYLKKSCLESLSKEKLISYSSHQSLMRTDGVLKRADLEDIFEYESCKKEAFRQMDRKYGNHKSYQYTFPYSVEYYDILRKVMNENGIACMLYMNDIECLDLNKADERISSFGQSFRNIAFDINSKIIYSTLSEVSTHYKHYMDGSLKGFNLDEEFHFGSMEKMLDAYSKILEMCTKKSVSG